MEIESPDSQLVKLRAQLYMDAYYASGQKGKAIEWAKKLLEIAPGNFGATFVIPSSTPFTESKKAKPVAPAEQSAGILLERIIDKQFGTKPEQVGQAIWDTQKKKTAVFANQTLGWIEMTHQNHAAAEEHFKRVLDLQPGNGQVSEWLATVALAQRDPDKNILVLWSLARAAGYDGDGALPEDERERVGAELKDLYTHYTGSDKGMSDLLSKAKESPLPPPGFDLEAATYRD